MPWLVSFGSLVGRRLWAFYERHPSGTRCHPADGDSLFASPHRVCHLLARRIAPLHWPADPHGADHGDQAVRKIDIYNHVVPPAYLELIKQHSKDAGIVKRMTNLRMLWDLEARVEMLKTFP